MGYHREERDITVESLDPLERVCCRRIAGTKNDTGIVGDGNKASSRPQRDPTLTAVNDPEQRRAAESNRR
jgi:hypothetical protein